MINSTSAEPIYQQIARQIQESVITGELPPGSPLPSIRHLARELKVSIITTKRAYEELEADGFLQTTPGKGSFVTMGAKERLKEVAISHVEEKLSQAVDAARAMGLTKEEFFEITDTLWNTDM